MSRDSIHKPMVARAFGGNLEVGLAWWRDMYDRLLAYVSYYCYLLIAFHYGGFTYDVSSRGGGGFEMMTVADNLFIFDRLRCRFD